MQFTKILLKGKMSCVCFIPFIEKKMQILKDTVKVLKAFCVKNIANNIF